VPEDRKPLLVLLELKATLETRDVTLGSPPQCQLMVHFSQTEHKLIRDS